MSKANETARTRRLLEGIPVVFVTTVIDMCPRCRRPTGHASHHSGWPDRYVSHRDWHGWLEIKTHDGVLSLKQKLVMRALREADSNQAWVVRLPLTVGGDCAIEDEEGVVHARCDENAESLIRALRRLR